MQDRHDAKKRLIIATAIVGAALGQANADLLEGRTTEHDLHIGSTQGVTTTPAAAAHFRIASEGSSRPLLLGGRITEHDLERQISSSGTPDFAAHFWNNPDVDAHALLGGHITARDLRHHRPHRKTADTLSGDIHSGDVATQ